MVAPAAIYETIIDVNEESTGVADGGTTGGTGDHTGVATFDYAESIGVTNIEDDDMAAIDAAIAEVADTLDQ